MYFVTGSAERVLVGEGTFEPGSAEEPPIVRVYGDISLSLAAMIDLRDFPVGRGCLKQRPVRNLQLVS